MCCWAQDLETVRDQYLPEVEGIIRANVPGAADATVLIFDHAIRTGGEFHNGNRRQVPSDILNAAAKDSRKPLLEQLTLREYALLAVLLASLVLALLPVLLHYFGTSWRPGVRAGRQAA